MRKLMRSVARHNMLSQGYTKLNKKPKGGQSQFAKLWREFVGAEPIKGTRTGKKKITRENRFLSKIAKNQKGKAV